MKNEKSYIRPSAICFDLASGEPVMLDISGGPARNEEEQNDFDNSDATRKKSRTTLWQEWK